MKGNDGSGSGVCVCVSESAIRGAGTDNKTINQRQ